MSSTVKSSYNVPTAPVYMVQPVQSSSAAGQSGVSQPLISGEGAQQTVTNQMANQPGGQPVLIPVAYPPQIYGPMNPMPDEITDDLVYILSNKTRMILLLVLNYLATFFLVGLNLVPNIIGSIYFCEYSGWMMIIYAVGNGFSLSLSVYTSIYAFAMAAGTWDKDTYIVQGLLYLGMTVFYVVELVFSILYSNKAIRVSRKYTALQITNVEKSDRWRS